VEFYEDENEKKNELKRNSLKKKQTSHNIGNGKKKEDIFITPYTGWK
jgi:hypothetical protein